jgi:rRNA maturation RNase YbeY
MNKQFRGIDQATDVLSFAFLDKVEGEPSIKNAPFINLGALVISTEKAISQAQEYGHSLKREMSFLFVHGLLHLCGYDHQTNEQEQQMIALQTAILGKRDI